MINFPYNIACLPLRLTFAGIESSAEAIDEHPTLRRLYRLFPLSVGAALVSGGVSVGSQDGFGGNLSLDFVDFLAPENGLKLRLEGETRGARRATLGLRLFRGPSSRFELGGGYRSHENSRFYGIGPDASEDDESYYRREVSWAGVTWRRGLGGGLWGSLGANYSWVAATGGQSDSPHLSETFAGDLPPGYRDLSEGVSIGVELLHDDTEKIVGAPPGSTDHERGRPERGGLRRVTASRFAAKGESDAEFWTWRAELQQFLPLWHSRRALAVRAFVSRIEDSKDGPVPFQRLLTNDDPDLLRGYEDNRFHDRGLAIASAEYRWPIWTLEQTNGTGLDAYLFTDHGQVFTEFEDIDADHLTTSWGGGLRLVGDGRFRARLELGWSEEGLQFRLRADQIFQYEKSGLFFGRSPEPDR